MSHIFLLIMRIFIVNLKIHVKIIKNIKMNVLKIVFNTNCINVNLIALIMMVIIYIVKKIKQY